MITRLNNFPWVEGFIKIVKEFRRYHMQLQDLFNHVCQIWFRAFPKIQLSYTITNWFARQSIPMKTTLEQLENRIA
jgi:hypothetical protein